ncbi:MAG: ribonuclease HI family protein [Phycisphaerae bacterium]
MADPDAAEPESPQPPEPPEAPTGEPPAHLLVYVDGASSGNPGPCGAACVVKTPDGETVLDRARAFGPATNNVAEYQALLLGLETAAMLRPRRLTIRSDSQLLVRQVAGEYRVKSPQLKPLHRQARAMLEPFETVEIEHVGREKNKEADALARKALEKSRKVDADLPPEQRKHAPPKSYRLK